MSDEYSTVRVTPVKPTQSEPGRVIQFREVEMPADLQARISHALKYGRQSHYIPMDPIPVPTVVERD